jgi:hypothetical protein
MNSYNLGISGSWLFLILLLLLAIAFTIFTYYRTNPQINRGKKTFLVGLRALGLVLLIFALFEPVFTGYSSSVIAPKIAVLFDNSASMGIADAGGSRKEIYKKAIDNSKITSLNEDESSNRLFGENIKFLESFTFDSLNFSGNTTDISESIRSLFAKKNDDNLRAVVMFTDGAFNFGQNPLYSVEELALPVFTIGIGDTTEPRDISIQSLILNEVAYIENPVPVNANIKVVGYPNQELKISILDNNNLLESRTIKADDDYFESTVYFTYIPKESGNRKITVRIEEKEGEITFKNNSISEYIKVLKNKRIISLFGGAPNADISFVKQYLNTLPGIEIKEFIQSSGSAFFKQPNENDIADTELFILIGFPIQTTPDNIMDKIARELANGKPILLITSLNTDFIKMRKIEEYLPFNTASSRAVEFSINADFTPKAVSSPLLRVNGTDDDIDKWKNLPPIFRTETFVRAKPESELVATFKVNNVPLNEPFIITRNMNSRKSVAIIGYGLHRWKLLGYAAEVAKGRTDIFDAFTKLIENTVRWLSVSDLNRRINITTTKKSYSKGERVEFVGQVYDASYLPVDNAVINVSVSGGEETREISMVSVGSGRYSANLDGLNSGDFNFSANILRTGNKIGSDNGRFSIGETEVEYRNMRMESAFLRALSEMSGGKFYTAENVQTLLDDIKSLSSFKEKPLTKRNDFALWNYPWLLAIALFLFAVEWVVRKRSGMM